MTPARRLEQQELVRAVFTAQRERREADRAAQEVWWASPEGVARDERDKAKSRAAEQAIDNEMWRSYRAALVKMFWFWLAVVVVMRTLHLA